MASDASPMPIEAALTPADMAAAKALFMEYAAALDFPLCFQGFDQELATFPGAYGPPAGSLLLARLDEVPVGTVGLRPLEPGVGEMKRLYVRPTARASGLGRALAQAVITEARRLGYRALRLDTIQGRQDAAIALYRSLGFHEIPPYYDNPIPGALYLERRLEPSPSAAATALGRSAEQAP